MQNTVNQIIYLKGSKANYVGIRGENKRRKLVFIFTFLYYYYYYFNGGKGASL